MFKHNWTFVISIHMTLKLWPLFHSRPHYGILWEASFSDSEKIIIWYKFSLLLDRVFSEFFGTSFNPQSIEVRLKRFVSLCTH